MTNAVFPNDPGHLRARHPCWGPEAAIYTQFIHDADCCLMSAANFVELSIVIEGQIGADAGRQGDAFFRRAQIIIEPFTVEQAHRG